MTRFAFRANDFTAPVMTETPPQKKLVIAIDGPAASGKGSLARNLAARLNYAYLDTGSLYRAVGFAVLESGGAPDNPADAMRGVRLVQDKLTQEFLDNPKLKSDMIGQAGSKVAAIPDVRESLLAFQRDFALTPPEDKAGAILDGRDIGTVICPRADIKLFITADIEVRAQRRVEELAQRGIAASYDEVLADMKQRDARDQTRENAPLKKAKDAFVIDTSTLTPSEVLAEALALIRAKLIDQAVF